jgi:hypothetical protein
MDEGSCSAIARHGCGDHCTEFGCDSPALVVREAIEPLFSRQIGAVSAEGIHGGDSVTATSYESDYRGQRGLIGIPNAETIDITCELFRSAKNSATLSGGDVWPASPRRAEHARSLGRRKRGN